MTNWQNNFIQFKSLSNLDSLLAAQLREKSFSDFLQNGLPTKKNEAWKFTSIQDFKNIEWKNPEAGEDLLTHSQMQEISKNLPSEFYNLVFVNGILNLTLSDDLTEQIQVCELETTDFKNSDLHTENQWLNLAQAFLAKKIKIEIKKNQVFEKPLQIIFVQSSKSHVFASEKIDIHVQEKAELTMILHSMSFANSTGDALNLNTQIHLDNAAHLKLVLLQNEDVMSYHFSQTEIALKANCHLHAFTLSLGTVKTRNYLHLQFLDKNSFAAVDGLSVLDLNQHVDHYTFIQHSVGENQSEQHYKSILSGSSESVFRGRVRIEAQAQKANSNQLNNNLLLTREAQANSVPQLEIYADDVKAGHGSTTGQLNKDEIFYFLSRGINQYEAVKMLSYGYAKELIYKFENQTVQNFIFKFLQTKLESLIQNV